jgi:hypothetical protein
MGGDKVRVGEDFELLGFDFVSNPSTQGAFLGPVNESAGQPNPNQIGTDICGQWCKTQHLIREIIEELN